MSAPIDPITYQHAAMQWLEEHGYIWEQARERWELVDLERAEMDDDDAFFFASSWYRVANPEEFGVLWPDTTPMHQVVEPWTLAPPDIEPPEEKPSPEFGRAGVALAWIAVVASALSLFAMQVVRSNP